MGMDIYGLKATAEAGNYFRANIWGWSPILGIAQSANEIYGLGIDMSAWSFNDGAGLKTQDECNQLADAMENLLTMEGNTIKADHMECATALAAALGMKTQEQAETTREHAQEFVTFLRNCGGFQIC
jgi:hypothetical protein